jgi:uncharacterized protein (DUF1330 family)
MPAFFVALRESVHDPEEMQLYADKAAGSAAGHRLVTRVAYGRLRMTEGAPIEGAVVLEFPTFEEAEAVAIHAPTAATGAAFKQANSSTPST